jgi:hypothetical protein
MEEIKFKRFGEEKQEQVRQLVAYTTLMGLTGKDLISIGTKLERERRNAEAERLWNIVDSYKIEPTGRYAGRNYRRSYINQFKLTYNGKIYHFEDTNWYNVVIKQGNRKRSRQTKDYDNEVSCLRVNAHVVRVILNLYNKDIDLEAIFK